MSTASDEGYLSLLWCYVHYGYAFVMRQGAYDASSVLNSLDSVFGEFLTLLCDFEHEMQKYTKGVEKLVSKYHTLYGFRDLSYEPYQSYLKLINK